MGGHRGGVAKKARPPITPEQEAFIKKYFNYTCKCAIDWGQKRGFQSSDIDILISHYLLMLVTCAYNWDESKCNGPDKGKGERSYLLASFPGAVRTFMAEVLWASSPRTLANVPSMIYFSTPIGPTDHMHEGADEFGDTLIDPLTLQPDEQVDTFLTHALLQRALSCLPHRMRWIIIQSVILGYTYEEIGVALEISRERVRQELNAGLELLRKALNGSPMPDPEIKESRQNKNTTTDWDTITITAPLRKRKRTR